MRCQGLAAGCIGTYVAMDFQRWRAQERRRGRRDEIQQALWYRKAELLEHWHDFKTEMQRQGAMQLATDSTKLVLSVIPGAAVLGETADTVNDAANLHDLYELVSEMKDVSVLHCDEEAGLMDVLARNDSGRRAIQSKLEIAQLEKELSILSSDFWSGHPHLESGWIWHKPLTYCRPLFRLIQPFMTEVSGICSAAPQESDRYAKVFALVDKDSDGSINKAEFKRALLALDSIDGEWRDLLHGDLTSFFLWADADGDGKIEANDFILWVQTTRALIACFKAMDRNGDGLIDAAEFKEAVHRLSGSLQQIRAIGAESGQRNHSEVEAEFNDIDRNKDGRISLPEFVGWMHKSSPENGLRAVLMRVVNMSMAHTVSFQSVGSQGLQGLKGQIGYLSEASVAGVQDAKRRVSSFFFPS